ncbi:MAG: hypothetical protein M3548_16695 [Actinomycetota bacterium]|nr:hypothetical protein [Actinomycetota bacterium]
MADVVPPDLVRHVSGTTGLPASVAARVVADVVAYFGESVDDFVRRRHAELRLKSVRNAQIWSVIVAELATRPVVAPTFTERQLRRIVYG